MKVRVKKRAFLMGLFAAVVWAMPVAAAQEVSLQAISSYLGGLRTAQSAFVQTNADQSVSRGTLYIQRPGRLRLEYEPSEKMLVVAGGGQVAIFDGKSIGNPTQYPLRRTPLNLLLGRDIDLVANSMVIDHRFDGAETRIIVQDPEYAEYGWLELVFVDDPVRLRQWTMVDNAGSRTRVDLQDLEEGMTLGASLFSIPLEAENWE